MGIEIHPNARALIFDLDGTLSDSLPVHMETWEKVGEAYGFRFDPKILIEMTGRATIDFARRIVDEQNLNATPEELVKLKQHIFWESIEQVEPIHEIVSIVKTWSGKLPLAVGTGASRRSAEAQLTELQILHHFDTIVTADDVTKHKPDPETFLMCAAAMGVEPAKCQVFEDGDLGIKAAQKAGMIVTDVRPHINYGSWMNS